MEREREKARWRPALAAARLVQHDRHGAKRVAKMGGAIWRHALAAHAASAALPTRASRVAKRAKTGPQSKSAIRQFIQDDKVRLWPSGASFRRRRCLPSAA